MKARLVVVESPYAGDIEANVRYARECVLDSLRRDEAPYASHLLFTQPGILDDARAEERALGIEAGLAWAAHASYAAVYLDRGLSRGMQIGIRCHLSRRIPIYLRSLAIGLPSVLWTSVRAIDAADGRPRSRAKVRRFRRCGCLSRSKPTDPLCEEHARELERFPLTVAR